MQIMTIEKMLFWDKISITLSKTKDQKFKWNNDNGQILMYC